MPITSQNVPGAPKRPTPDDPYPEIEARPLQMPDFVNIKPKNPLLALRWVNRAAGEGQRLDQMTFAGFRPVRPDECVIPDANKPGVMVAIPPSMQKNGQIIYGDLLCMAIDKKIYDGALKYNWSRAIQRMKPGANKETAQSALKQTLNEVSDQARKVPELTRKLQVYQPSESDVAKAEAKGEIP